jgi:hypothetical protein
MATSNANPFCDTATLHLEVRHAAQAPLHAAHFVAQR